MIYFTPNLAALATFLQHEQKHKLYRMQELTKQ